MISASPHGRPGPLPELQMTSHLRSNIARGPDGRPVQVFAVLAHAGTVAAKIQELSQAFFAPDSALASDEREVAVLRICARGNSEYEVAQHRLLARDAGLGSDLIDAVLDLQAAPPGRWRPLLDFVDEFHRTGSVTGENWDAATRDKGESWAVELVVLISHFQAMSLVTNTLRVVLDPWLVDAAAT